MGEKWMSTKKPWGRGCVILVVQNNNGGTSYTFREEEIAALLAKNIVSTARTQLDGCQLPFREHLLFA